MHSTLHHKYSITFHPSDLLAPSSLQVIQQTNPDYIRARTLPSDHPRNTTRSFKHSREANRTRCARPSSRFSSAVARRRARSKRATWLERRDIRMSTAKRRWRCQSHAMSAMLRMTSQRSHGRYGTRRRRRRRGRSSTECKVSLRKRLKLETDHANRHFSNDNECRRQRHKSMELLDGQKV